MDGTPDRNSSVVKKCLDWISKSDFMFVWLDSADAYGTIVEIGYAKALNKPIFFALDSKFKDESFAKDIWFAKTMSNWFVYADNANEAWKEFKSVIEKQTIEPFVSYITDEKTLRNLRTKTSEYCNRLTKNKKAIEINALDRRKLAQDFIGNKTIQYMVPDVYSTKKFFQDVMIELDYKLVRGFLRNQNTDKPASLFQSWNIAGTGLVYKFDSNYRREENARETSEARTEKQKIPKATESQIRYINTLLGRINLELKPIEEIGDLDVRSASDMIDSLVAKQQVPELFADYTTTKQLLYNKADVIRLLKSRINKPVTHKMHNNLIMNFNGKDAKYSNGKHFNDAWIDFVADLLKNEELYNFLKEVTKNKYK